MRRQVEHLRAVMAGTAEPEEFTGNAYAVIPGRDVTVIEGMYGEPPMMIEVPTSELADLLDRWGAILLAANGPDKAATKP